MLMNAVQANARQYFFIHAIWTIQREEDLRKDEAKNDAHTSLLSHILYYCEEEPARQLLTTNANNYAYAILMIMSVFSSSI